MGAGCWGRVLSAGMLRGAEAFSRGEPVALRFSCDPGITCGVAELAACSVLQIFSSRSSKVA